LSLAALTVMLKGASLAEDLLSLTEIVMPVVVPTWAALGVPLSVPLEMLKEAHEGLLLTEKLLVPEPPLVVGWKR
jgi:hypothetical protein